ncbi:MAG: response regulator transcription factor [Erysipelothrix sp.]|nr:response regulator transcription factor [Erysipelothrix sp.]
MYKVLLIDDEYMILKGLEKLIDWNDLGLELVGAVSNGQEAYNFVQDHHIDIVVTDVNMPVMDGIEFVKKTKDEDLNFYIILLSGYQEFEYVKQGIQLGVENFIQKPIDKEILRQSLINIVVKLDEEKNKLESDKLVFSNILLKWVSGEVESTDLRRLLKLTSHPLKANGSYSILLFDDIGQDLHQFFRDENQMLFFKDLSNIVLIFEGDIGEFESFILKVKQKFDIDQIVKGVGEFFVEQDFVHESYVQAIHNSNLISFYQGHPIPRFLSEGRALNEPINYVKQDFSNFHQALSLRDEKKVFKELNALMRQLKEEKTAPDFIRYNVFILISDIYREFGIEDIEMINKSMQKIYQSDTILQVESTLYQVYHDVSQSLEEKVYSDLVKELLSIIISRFNEDLSLLNIADELHVNSMYLGQLFIKELGVSFSKYLNTFRIKKAQEFIVNTNTNFSEISEKTGYSSPGYFYKKFKKECGLSPSEYRNKYRRK